MQKHNRTINVVGGEGVDDETLEGGTEEPSLSVKVWRKAAEDVYQQRSWPSSGQFVGTSRRLAADDVNLDIEN